MKKVVINKCFGGFNLSELGVLEYAKLSGFKLYGYVDERMVTRDFSKKEYCIRYENAPKDMLIVYWIKEDLGDRPTMDALNKAEWFHEREIARDDAVLVKVVEKLKKKANSRFSELKIVKIPDGVEYEISEYDGFEHIAEKHRTWG